MRAPRRAAALVAAAATAFGLAGATPGGAQTAVDPVWVVTATGQLLTIDADDPTTVIGTVVITGLAGGEDVVGIDVRPATGQLFGVTDASRVVVIDPTTGAATPVGSGFTPALSGAAHGVDFNPTVDRIRVVGDDAQNLRLNPATGAAAATDGPLAFAAGDPNAAAAAEVEAAAYTSSLNGATSTVLYGIDVDLDVLVTQNPPNNGTLNTVGPLGVDATEASFDITAADGVGLAALRVGGSTGLYTVDLATGAATLVGAIGAGDAVVGLAAPVPTVGAGFAAWGLTVDGRIARLGGATAGAVTSSVAVSGLGAGERLVGIDVRPASGQLYGVSSASRVYAVNPVSGVATPIGTAAFTPAVTGTAGVDFNPTVDRIRLVTDAEQNLRLHPDTGAAVAADGTLAYATGDANVGADPAVIAAAYTNSVAGATTTTLYGLDATARVLVTQNPPNNGTLNTVGPLGITGAITEAGFDISPAGRAVAVLTVAGTSRLYDVSLTTGAATLVGITGLPLADLAFPEPLAGLGYSIAGSGGGVDNFGQATDQGDATALGVAAPIVGIGHRPAGQGYWLAARDGGVFGFGAPFLGSAVGTVTEPVVGIAVHPSGLGYWLVTNDGEVVPLGQSAAFGDARALDLNHPIVGIAATPSGRGYWLFASDGGVFAYGDAPFAGSAGALPLNQPVVGGAATADGRGYWLVARDGGVFSYGTAAFSGSTGAIRLNQPIVGMAADRDGVGYQLVARDGGVFAFDAPFLGSGVGGSTAPVVGIAAR